MNAAHRLRTVCSGEVPVDKSVKNSFHIRSLSLKSPPGDRCFVLIKIFFSDFFEIRKLQLQDFKKIG